MSGHRHSFIGRAWRFSVVGLLTAAIHYGLLAVGVELLDLNSTLSSSISFLVCVIFNYLMHYSWTFAGAGEAAERPHGRTLVRYIAMIAGGFFINMSIMHTGVAALHWHYLLVQFLAHVLVVVWNFTLANGWVFRSGGD